MNGHSPASAASDFLVPGLIVLVPGFVLALGVVFGGDPAKVLAFLLSALTVAASLALACGFAVLTRVYVRAVQEVLFHGGNPRVPGPGPEDPAEFGYHGGPAWWDLAEVGSRVAVGTGPFVVLLLPHLAVQAVLVLTHLALAWTAVAVLRLVDGGLLRYRRIRMLCPRCFEHMTYPSHECDRCGRVHRDVRPGRRGLLRRRCLCGRSMPTLLLLGAAGLGALCPHCGQGMEHRPGEARELPVALFGGTGAGKTRLTHGLYAALEHAAAGRPGARVEPADEDTRHRLGGSALALSPGRRVPPTRPGRRARGLALRVTAGTRTLLLQVYDAAGEWFDRTDRTEELTYLGRTGTFVLVVDPLSVPAVWKALGAGEQRRLAGERSLTPDPERPYMQVRDEVQRQYLTSGRGLWRSRLAVVVTRGDLLAGTSLAPADVPAERWVREVMGLNNLLRAARSDFGSVEVFVTGAVVGPGGDPDPSLTTLLRWLLVPEAEQFTGLVGPGPAPSPLPGSVPNPDTHAARTGPTRTGRAR
ncbi:TRAFAC clade GTPase domain-containing protein [Nocardiopsis terrae]